MTNSSFWESSSTQHNPSKTKIKVDIARKRECEDKEEMKDIVNGRALNELTGNKRDFNNTLSRNPQVTSLMDRIGINWAIDRANQLTKSTPKIEPKLYYVPIKSTLDWHAPKRRRYKKHYRNDNFDCGL